MLYLEFSCVVNDLPPTSPVTKDRLADPSKSPLCSSEHEDKQSLLVVIEGLIGAKYLD